MTTRLPQPCEKYLVCSKPQATANASPSTGTYLSSVDDKNLDPANVTSQPELQQPGILVSCEQCFWSKIYLISLFDQSCLKQVHRLESMISTPCRIASVVAVLKSEKCFIELNGALKFVSRIQKWLKRCKNVMKLRVIWDLVNSTKPTSNICYVFRSGKVLNGIQLLRQRLHSRLENA